MNSDTPSHIGKYEVLGVLGEGGMGIVYRAQDKRMGRQVAIKTVTEDFNSDPTMLERFYQEAEKTGRLQHPNIVTIYDLGEQDGMPYIVMEMVDGQALDRLIRDNRAMPMLDKLRIIEQVCSALGYAHRHDVIHRDVKPANIIVQRDGSAKLLDFGIAREETRKGQGLTRTGVVIGTIPYMAPERLRGAPLDARSDIFAIGVVLYQTLTGQLPFQGEDAELVNKLFNAKHPPLSTYLQNYPPALDSIMERALAKNPDDRYSTADEMATELFALIDQMKREHIGEVIQQVKRLTTEQNFVQARDSLLQLLKLDNQHGEARTLLSQVQQHLAKKQKEDQAQMLAQRAEDLAREKDFKKAIDLLDQAVKMVPDDISIQDLLEDTRRKKTIHDHIEELLHKADAARNRGDIVSARAIVEDARALDAKDPRVEAIYQSLARHEEEAEERARARELMEQAQGELNQRHYAIAVQLLREAIEIDPLNQQLQAMFSSANARAQQEERRNTLDEIANDVARAVTYEQAQAAQSAIQAAIRKIGADPVLLRLQVQVAKQVRDFEAKKLVEDTVRDCRAMLDSSPSEALNLVEAALERLPTNELLLALRAEVEERVARVRRDEVQTKFLQEAHKAVAENRFSDAVQVLESCDSDLRSRELAELLEFARNEARRDEHRRFMAETVNRGQQLIRDGMCAEAIAFLTPILAGDLAEEDQPGLRALLKQAETQHTALTAKAVAATAEVQSLSQMEAYEQVMVYLESLPMEVQRQSAVQQAMEQARDGAEREREMAAILGESYALLASENASLEWREVKEMDAGRGVMAGMIRALKARRTSVATGRITATTKAFRAALLAGDTQPVEELLERQMPLVPYCSPEAQTQWNTLINEVNSRNDPRRKGR